VFGISAAIRHLDAALRVRVIAASSAMWILPALVGPAATLALEHVLGWRWTLLVPVSVVLVGRFLVVRAGRADHQEEPSPPRPLWRTLLVPTGVSGLVLTSGHGSWWPIAVGGAVVSCLGVATILRAGTARLRRGAPAALGAMLLFATGYFGADCLITVLLMDGYRTTVARAAIVLSAAPLGWGLTSLLAPRLRRRSRAPSPVAGLLLTAGGVAVLAAAPLVSMTFAAPLAAWTVAGIGVGLAYPTLYMLCTPSGCGEFDSAELATAVITAEAFGGLLGRAAGGAVASLEATTTLSRQASLMVAYAMFAVILAVAALAATRSGHRAAAATR
jgi:hypothetical protein